MGKSNRFNRFRGQARGLRLWRSSAVVLNHDSRQRRRAVAQVLSYLKTRSKWDVPRRIGRANRPRLG